MEKTAEIEVIEKVLTLYGFDAAITEQKAYIHAIEENGRLKLIFRVTLAGGKLNDQNCKKEFLLSLRSQILNRQYLHLIRDLFVFFSNLGLERDRAPIFPSPPAVTPVLCYAVSSRMGNANLYGIPNYLYICENS